MYYTEDGIKELLQTIGATTGKDPMSYYVGGYAEYERKAQLKKFVITEFKDSAAKALCEMIYALKGGDGGEPVTDDEIHVIAAAVNDLEDHAREVYRRGYNAGSSDREKYYKEEMAANI